ncbi:MAG: Gfo/Idh/MocA family oxidoreductase [Planctomycetaceae bacterium]|nr:Gfo/Idh/MocA family oxidoreductase [Planctomycetaceae bacterium]
MTDQNSRRDFLKTSSVAALGAGLLSTLPNMARAYADGDDAIKVGLVGCGGRGSGAAEQALSVKPKVKITAMGDAFRHRLDGTYNGLREKFRDQPERVDVSEDQKYVGLDAYQKVIDSGVDFVILATPPGFRPVHFEAAIKAGKHVFMEKPVAVDAEGVRKVLAAAEEAKKKNLKIGVGLQRHHQASYLQALEQLRNGAIGDIISMRVYWNGGGVWDPRKTREEAGSEMGYQVENWYYYTWLCGDHICEQHIHNLDVGNWWKDAYPVVCRGMGGREVRTDKKYGQIFDHFACQYEYEDGTTMISECRHIPNTWGGVFEVAQGTKGTLTTEGRMRIQQGGKTSWAFRGDNPNPYQVEHDNLHAAIREDKEFNEAYNGAMSTMTAILGRMATYSGKEITMKDALERGVTIYPYGQELTFDSTPPVVPDKDGWYPIPVPGQTNQLT